MAQKGEMRIVLGNLREGCHVEDSHTGQMEDFIYVLSVMDFRVTRYLTSFEEKPGN